MFQFWRWLGIDGRERTGTGGRRRRRARLLVEALEQRLTPGGLSFVVSDTADDASDHDSLRYAINQINQDTAGGGTDVITFDPSLKGATISLTGSLALTNATPGLTIRIDASLAPGLTLDGGGNATVVTVDTSVTAALTGLTIANGVGGDGGGIFNQGTLTVNDCIFNGNSAGGFHGGAGGAIDNSETGSMTVADSAFVNNSASGAEIHEVLSGGVLSLVFDPASGGAIENDGTMTLDHSSFTGNFAGVGGAVQNDGALTVGNGCTFTDNSAIGAKPGSVPAGSVQGAPGLGGAINSVGSPDVLAVSNCTFAGNTAADGGAISIETDSLAATVTGCTFSDNSGGGLLNEDSTTEVADCTFSGNTASTGGGISNVRGILTVTDCTVTGNFAGAGGGGGIANDLSASKSLGGLIPAGGTLTLNGVIVVGNTNTITATPDDVSGDGLDPSSSDNLVGVDATGPDGDGSLVGGQQGNQVGVSLAAAGLDPDGLKDNGGPTQTIALLPGSLALNRGITETKAAFDQRGVARPVGSPGDVGAYQHQIGTPPAFTGPDAVTFYVGEDGSFTVSATGAPNPTVFAGMRTPNGILDSDFSIAGVNLVSDPDGSLTLRGTPQAGTEGVYALPLFADNGVGTDPTETLTVTVAPAPTPAASAVGGTLFADANGNGTLDPGESGPAGLTVFLDANGDGVLDPGEPSAVAGFGGFYGISVATPGTSVLSVATPAYHGLLYSGTAAQRAVVVPAGGSVLANLGVVPISQVFPVVGVTTGQSPSANALTAVTPDRYAPRSSPDDPDAVFVRGLYHTVLGRDADAAGLAGFVAAIKGGASRAAVVDAFFNSAEHRAEEVDAFYQTFFGRAVDANDPQDVAGRAGFVAQLQGQVSSAAVQNLLAAFGGGGPLLSVELPDLFRIAGGRAPEELVALEFVLSPEYAAKHADGASFVGAVFSDVLGHAPDAGQLASGVAQLAGGTSRGDFALGVILSDESFRRAVTSFYFVELHRAPDQPGLAGALSDLESGRRDGEGVAEALYTASSEFSDAGTP